MSASTPSTKSFFHIPPDGNPVAVPDLDSALDVFRGGGYVWINLLDPARVELEALSGPFGLHPLTIEDCLDDEQIPKIEDYPANTFILFNKFHYEANELFIDEVDLFLGRNFLILVSHNMHGDPSFLDRLEQMAALDRENVLQGPDYLLHVVMDYLVDQKFHAVGSLQDELDVIEERIISDIGSFRPEELMRLRRHLLRMRKSITHEREILVKICRKDSRFITEQSIYHFRDIYDHLSKFFEETEIYREMVSSFMEMYLSMMNNRMTMLANRTNRVVRRLTMITTIFMPMTLLSGIGGMSEWSMMTGAENWKMAYPAFLFLMMLVGIASYLILKRLEVRDNDSQE
jgi:magnesium transporter